jgi:hypothetical protein
MEKKVILWIIALTGFLSGGCSPESEEDKPLQTESRISARASDEDITTKSMHIATRSDDAGPVVFTGSDILWFNETTRELRFNDNISQKQIIDGALGRSIRFYIDDEYLFSSMQYASPVSSQTYNGLVFYYDLVENKYFLMVGYPFDVSVLPNPQETQESRDENMKQIANEWNKFVEQLKAEGRYRE